MKRKDTRNLELSVYNRNSFARFFKWTHVINLVKVGRIFCDFGCAEGDLCSALYHNKLSQKQYVGLDYRSDLISKATKKNSKAYWAYFKHAFLASHDSFPFNKINANVVCSLDALQTVPLESVDTFLCNFKDCGDDDAIYILSSDIFDHLHTSVDAELTYIELTQILKAHFDILGAYGTVVKEINYKSSLRGWHARMHQELSKYYDNNLMSCMMAPLLPEASRNVLWVLSRKDDDLF